MRRCSFLIALMILCCALPSFSQDKPSVAVLDLQTTSVSEKEMEAYISLLSSSLFRTGVYTVIDISNRESLLEETEFSYSGCVDEACQIEIGKELSATYIITGSIGSIGTRYAVSLKMLETSSGRTMETADGIYQSLDEAVDSVDAIAFALTGQEVVAAAEASRKPVNTRKVLGFTGIGAGTVFSGLGTLLIVQAIQALNGPVQEALDTYNAAEDDFDSYYRLYENELASAKGTFIWGAVAAGTGLLSLGGGIMLLAVKKAPDGAAMILPDIRPVSTDNGTVGLRLGVRIQYGETR